MHNKILSEQIWKRLLKPKKIESHKTGSQKLLAIKHQVNNDDSDDNNGNVFEIDTHNVGLYLEKIHHKSDEIEDPYLKKMESIKKLRKILKK